MNLELKTLTLDSRDVAKMLNKNHADLLRDILRNITYFTESNFAFSEFFQENQYKDSTGKRNKRYDITKKGCEFLAHKLTGKKGAIFTANYINKFHEMEQQLANPKLPFEEKEKIIPTTWRGQPVMELQELSKIIGINDTTVHWHFQKEKLTLKKNELREYKKENKTNRGQASLSILYKETVIAICKHFNVYGKYKDIIENYFRTDNKIENKTSKVPSQEVFNDKYYKEMYECMQKAYNIESRIEKIYNEELLPLYNRIEKLNEIKRDCMISLFNGMKYGNILGKTKLN